MDCFSRVRTGIQASSADFQNHHSLVVRDYYNYIFSNIDKPVHCKTKLERILDDLPVLTLYQEEQGITVAFYPRRKRREEFSRLSRNKCHSILSSIFTGL